MERKTVSSSNIHSIGYDSSELVLEVEFHKSGVYRYHGVPDHVYEELKSATSVGTYFNQFVKNTYEFTKE